MPTIGARPRAATSPEIIRPGRAHNLSFFYQPRRENSTAGSGFRGHFNRFVSQCF